jgi:phage-related protein
MAIQAAQLIARVSVEGDAEAKAKLQGVSESVKETSGGFKSMLGGAMSFVTGMVAFAAASAAVMFLKDQVSDLLRVTLDHQQIAAQTNQVLQSTHDVSRMTASAIDDLASSFSKTTMYSADTVQGGENLLLTFTQIGKSVFPQATQAILDVSTAMHQDLKSSAVEVGKALGDPLKGMTALQRIGVTFSASQKEAVKQMMAVGNVAGAQKIILKELATEFGGSATAAGKTFAGQMAILKNNMEDLKIKIGTALLPALTGFLTFITGTVLPGLSNFKDMVSQFLAPLGPLFQFIAYTAHTAFKDIGDTLSQVGQIFHSVFGGMGGKGDNPLTMFFSDLIGKAYPIIQTIGQAFHGFMMNLQKDLSTINPQDILNFFATIGNAFNTFMSIAVPVLQTVGGILKGQFTSDFQTLLSIGQQVAGWVQSSLVPAFQKALPGFENLGNIIFTKVVPALATLWSDGQKVVQALLPVFLKIAEVAIPILITLAGFIASKLVPAVQFLIPYVMQAAKEVVKFAQEIATRAMPIITTLGTLISTVLNFIMAHWSAIWGVLGPIVGGVFNVIKGIIMVAWSVITGIFKVALDLISGNWKGAWTDIKNMVHGIWDGIVSIFKGAFGIISGILGGWIDKVIGFFVGLWDKLTGHSIIPDMINSIISWFAQLPGRALSAVGGLLGQLAGFFGGLASQALQWGANILANLATGILNNIGSTIGNAMSAVGGFISSHLPASPAKLGPLRDLATQGAHIPDEISKGIMSGIPKLAPSLNLALAPQYAAPAMTGASGGGGGSQSVSVNVYLNGRALTSELMPHIVSQIRSAVGSIAT